MRFLKQLIGGASAVAIVAMMTAMIIAPQSAEAVTAANATIKNVVTVSYGDGAGFTTSTTATNFVIVDLKTAAPTLSAPADATISAGGTATFTYTITSNANGSDIYNLSAISTDANVSAPTIDFYSNAALTTVITGGNVTLGASDVHTAVTIAATGTTTITVPADQVADGSVNGIIAGDTISINGNVFTVASIVDNGGTNAVGTSSITVNGNGAAVPLTAGMLIEEQKTFYMAVKAGTLAGVGNGTHTVTLSAGNGVDPAATDVTVTTISGPSLQVDKYSANLTSGVAGSGTAVTVDGVAFYPSGVVAKPGEQIGYLVIITNNGAGNATGVKVVDPIPAYTTYVANSLALDATGAGTTTGLTDGIGDNDAGEVNATSSEITVYAGSGGVNNGGAYGGGTGGTVAGGATSYVRFTVTVD